MPSTWMSLKSSGQKRQYTEMWLADEFHCSLMVHQQIVCYVLLLLAVFIPPLTEMDTIKTGSSRLQKLYTTKSMTEPE